jgi:hypothetical protein
MVRKLRFLAENAEVRQAPVTADSLVSTLAERRYSENDGRYSASVSSAARIFSTKDSTHPA